MADARVEILWPELNAFLSGPVAGEIAIMVGPPVARTAEAIAPIGVTSPRPGRLKRSYYWALLRDEESWFVQVGGRIWDMDLEAPADQLHHRYPGVVTALEIALPRVMLL